MWRVRTEPGSPTTCALALTPGDGTGYRTKGRVSSGTLSAFSGTGLDSR
jgi:hypothetical protein